MSAKRYAIPEPTQSRHLGGWFGSVKTEDQKITLFETFQPTKRMALVECALWIMDYNTLHNGHGWRPDAETFVEPPPVEPLKEGDHEPDEKIANVG